LWSESCDFLGETVNPAPCALTQWRKTKESGTHTRYGRETLRLVFCAFYRRPRGTPAFCLKRASPRGWLASLLRLFGRESDRVAGRLLTPEGILYYVADH
jgi:hypothetical protein